MNRVKQFVSPITSMTSEVISPLPAMAAGAKAFSSVSKRVISDAHLLDDALYEDESREIATVGSSAQRCRVWDLPSMYAISKQDPSLGLDRCSRELL